jgi:hypothetical protein
MELFRAGVLVKDTHSLSLLPLLFAAFLVFFLQDVENFAIYYTPMFGSIAFHFLFFNNRVSNLILSK